MRVEYPHEFLNERKQRKVERYSKQTRKIIHENKLQAKWGLQKRKASGTQMQRRMCDNIIYLYVFCNYKKKISLKGKHHSCHE